MTIPLIYQIKGKTCTQIEAEPIQGPRDTGDAPGYADYIPGPLVAHATTTEDGPALLSVPGMQDRQDRLSADETFQTTAPDLD